MITYNLQIKHDMEMKLTPINFSHQVAESSKSSWLQILGNQLINCSPYIRYTTVTPSITYCIILLDYVNESQVNACIV